MCRLQETGAISQELLVKLQTTQADLSNALHQVTGNQCLPPNLCRRTALQMICTVCILLLTLPATAFVLDGRPVCAQCESQVGHTMVQVAQREVRIAALEEICRHRDSSATPAKQVGTPAQQDIHVGSPNCAATQRLTCCFKFALLPMTMSASHECGKR